MADFAGTTGPDTWFGTNAGETAHGGDGADHLDGGAGDDFIYGEGGDDQLTGGPVNDLLDGGAGDDILYINVNEYGVPDLYSGDQFVGGSGYDTLTLYNSASPIDISGVSIAADIEELNAVSAPVRLTIAKLGQFSAMRGAIFLLDSGTMNLANKLMAGGLILANGDDNVSLAGGTQFSSVFLDGRGGNDVLIGSDNADGLSGGDGNDRLEGRIGADTLDGGAGDDVLIGGEGNDDLTDGFGADFLDGGAGDDLFRLDFEKGFGAGDVVAGGSGVDTIWFTAHFAGAAVDLAAFNPTADIEVIDGSGVAFIGSVARFAQFERFSGGSVTLTTAGSLSLSSNFTAFEFRLSDAGNTLDLTAGGIDWRRVTGGAGADIVHGGNGNDEISGGQGVDWIDGGAGNDTLIVREGESVSAGDRFTGGSGVDTLRIDGLEGVADLTGAILDADLEQIQSGRLVRLRLDQFNQLNAVFGTGGLELADGGEVDLTKHLVSNTLTLSAAGNRVLVGPNGVYEVKGGASADEIQAGSSLYAMKLSGGGGDDIIVGGAVDDELRGGSGNDRIDGGNGGDLLDGGTGDDVLRGGQGSDTYVVDSAADQVVELAGEGQDTVRTTVSFRLAAGVEVETLLVEASATGPVDLTGNEFANNLIGNDGDNLLDGGAGADILSGGLGDDTYMVDNVGDRVVENSGWGNDTVLAAISYALDTFDSIETLRAADVTSTAAINLTGNIYDNTIIGNAGANRLDGGWGNDRLEGGAGDDTLFAGGGTDKLFGEAGSDGLVFGAGFDAGDVADGGAGVDTVVLQGNYFGPGLPTAASVSLAGITNVEVLLLASGTDTRFGDTLGNLYLYRLAAADSNIAAGGTLNVMATGLKAGESLAFDGSAEMDGGFRVFAGQGVDSLKGGAGNDGFLFGADNNLTAADRIDGGAGTDSIALRGNYTLTFAAASFTGIEVITFLSGHSGDYGGAIVAGGFDYDITMADGNVAAGQQLQVIGGTLGADETLRFDGRAETDGSFRVIAGAANDTLYGGSGNDILYGGFGADVMDGGGGADTYLFRTAQDSTAAARDTIAFGAGDRIDLSLIDAIAGTPANDAFTFVGAAAFGHHAGELRAFQSGGLWMVEGDVNGDGTADFVLAVNSAQPLVASDFIP